MSANDTSLEGAHRLGGSAVSPEITLIKRAARTRSCRSASSSTSREGMQ
jgi:hypothetical protein